MARKSKSNSGGRGQHAPDLMKASWKYGENPVLEFLLGPTPRREDGLPVVDFLLDIATVKAMQGSGIHQDIVAEATDNLTEIGEELVREPSGADLAAIEKVRKAAEDFKQREEE